LALQVARSTPTAPLAQPHVQAERHATVAVGLLGKARRANAQQVKQWRSDPDLRALLARHDFRELLQGD
jgi:hypothetical protein